MQVNELVSLVAKVHQSINEIEGTLYHDTPSDFANIVGELRDVLQSEVRSYLQATGAEEERELAASIEAALGDLMVKIGQLR